MNACTSVIILLLLLLFHFEPSNTVRVIKKRQFKNCNAVEPNDGPEYHSVVVNGLIFISGQYGDVPEKPDDDGDGGGHERRRREGGDDDVDGDKKGDKDEDKTTEPTKPTSPTTTPATPTSENKKKQKSCEDDEDGEENDALKALEKIIKILEDAGGRKENIVMTRNFVKSLEDSEKDLKKAYKKLFVIPPSQTTIEVSDLMNGAKILIDAIAILDSP